MRFNFALEVPDWVHDPHKVAALGENRWEAPYDSSTFRIHAKPAPCVRCPHLTSDPWADLGIGTSLSLMRRLSTSPKSGRSLRMLFTSSSEVVDVPRVDM
jgi:hypothetical protein